MLWSSSRDGAVGKRQTTPELPRARATGEEAARPGPPGGRQAGPAAALTPMCLSNLQRSQGSDFTGGDPTHSLLRLLLYLTWEWLWARVPSRVGAGAAEAPGWGRMSGALVADQLEPCGREKLPPGEWCCLTLPAEAGVLVGGLPVYSKHRPWARLSTTQPRREGNRSSHYRHERDHDSSSPNSE